MVGSKSIFISGGGSGIGRAVAELFAGRGWFVGIGDISESGMAETQALLPPGSCFTVRLDVREREHWDEALAAFGKAADWRIDAVFNNAGVAYGGALIDLNEDEIDRLLSINVRGVINGARAAHPWLKAAGPGACLLNTASAAALYGVGGMAIYSASKFAVRGLTEALSTEWEADGIRVCSLIPSFIDTPLLAGPANASTNQAKRDTVVAAGLPFTPIAEVAISAWNAVHGEQLHTLVGATAKRMNLAARFAPGYLRARARKLMAVRLGDQPTNDESQSMIDLMRERDTARAESVSIVGGERNLHPAPSAVLDTTVERTRGKWAGDADEPANPDKSVEPQHPQDRAIIGS